MTGPTRSCHPTLPPFGCRPCRRRRSLSDGIARREQHQANRVDQWFSHRCSSAASSPLCAENFRRDPVLRWCTRPHWLRDAACCLPHTLTLARLLGWAMQGLAPLYGLLGVHDASDVLARPHRALDLLWLELHTPVTLHRQRSLGTPESGHLLVRWCEHRRRRCPPRCRHRQTGCVYRRAQIGTWR